MLATVDEDLTNGWHANNHERRGASEEREEPSGKLRGVNRTKYKLMEYDEAGAALSKCFNIAVMQIQPWDRVLYRNSKSFEKSS